MYGSIACPQEASYTFQATFFPVETVAGGTLDAIKRGCTAAERKNHTQKYLPKMSHTESNSLISKEDEKQQQRRLRHTKSVCFVSYILKK